MIQMSTAKECYLEQLLREYRANELKESEESPDGCQKNTLCRTCIHAVPTIDAYDAQGRALICDLTVKCRHYKRKEK